MSDVGTEFSEALARIATARHQAQLWSAVKQFAGLLGYTHVSGADAAGLARGASGAVFYTDQPGVPAAIDQHIRYVSTPYVVRALDSDETFLISELRDNPRYSGPWSDLMAIAIRRGDGLAVPVHEEGVARAGFLFGGERPDASVLARAMLQVLSHSAFTHFQRLQTERHLAVPGGLTLREIECLHAIARGESDSVAAGRLGITARTVRFHMDNVKSKLSASSRTQAVAKALQQGLIVG